MSLTYIANCDGCDTKLEAKVGISLPFQGWACVSLPGNKDGLDYCPECWSTMFCSLLKNQGPEKEVASLSVGVGSSLSGQR